MQEAAQAPRGCAHHGLPISVSSRAWLETGRRASAFILVVPVACSVLGTWLQLREAPYPPRTYEAAPKCCWGAEFPARVARAWPGQFPHPHLATSHRPGLPSPCPQPPPLLARLFGEESGQFVFIQNHLRSHFGEMKREKRTSRAGPAGCLLVPAARWEWGGAGALSLRTPTPVPHLRPRLGVEGGGLAARICMKRTLAAHLQRRN